IEYVGGNDRAAEMNPLARAVHATWARDSHRRLLTLMRAERPDVAHFHNTFLMISPAAYYAARSAGVPVVQTLHNPRLHCPAASGFREDRPCSECRSEEHTSELQSRENLVCRLLLEKKKKT